MLRQLVISGLLAAFALPSAARTRPHYGGTLRVEIEGEPWQRPDGIARRLVLDGLTVLDAAGAVHPALATQWDSDGGDHRWQFRLRPGVHFHDGSPLTSVAAVAALNAACPSNCPWTAIRAVGSSVVFTSDAPMPNLPALLAGDQFLIALTVGADGKTPAGNTGTGPFTVAGFNNGVLTLTANDACWQGRPFVDAIEIHVHRSVHDQWLDLGMGRADLVEVPAEQIRQAQQQRLTLALSPPLTLLALQVSDTGALSNPMLRAAIAQAIDRGALHNVIFQKQGEITAALLPQPLSGYGFLFSTERDINKAHELRGGLAAPPLTFAVSGGSAIQLAAQRIALNLHEAGFAVQASSTPGAQAQLTLRTVPIAGAGNAGTLESLLRAFGESDPVIAQTPAALYKTERDFLARHTIIPLLDLPRAWAIGARVRDLHLGAGGAPDLASVSLEDVP
ncbi:MAG: ABC transporter substrate-binding protein [Terracidiphilus sp.]